MQCRLCSSNRLLSVLDLGATPPCEKFLTAEELDSAEATFPLHLRLCEDCLLLQIPALITPEETFTVDVAALRHRNPLSAYQGRSLVGVVRETWLRGFMTLVNTQLGPQNTSSSSVTPS